MRIASFNVENMFERAKALNLPTWEEGRPTLERHARINELLNTAVYGADDKAEIVKLLKELGLAKKDDGGEFAQLRQNRGHLLKRPQSGGIEIVANGRADWIGWVELKAEPVNELATRHTAMVMCDLDADVLGVIEAESRVALKNFFTNRGRQRDQFRALPADGRRGRRVRAGGVPALEGRGRRARRTRVGERERRLGQPAALPRCQLRRGGGDSRALHRPGPDARLEGATTRAQAGGEVRFMEHVVSSSPRKARLQERLDRWGIWPGVPTCP